MKRILVAVAIAGLAAAFAWIAAINMIDASMMVEGRVVDRRRSLPHFRNDGVLKHEARLVVSRGESSMETTLVAPGRHRLEVMTVDD